MAEKLAELTWTAFKKKHKLEIDDKALVKALGTFDKVDEGRPEAKAEALLEVIEQINKQVVSLARVKKQIGDKPFAEAKGEVLGAASLLPYQNRRQSKGSPARSSPRRYRRVPRSSR